MTVLELIAGDPVTGMRATDVAAAIDTPLPTAYHLLNTLVGGGFLTKLDNRRYHLGPKVGLLAEAFASRLSAPEYLLERVRLLAERTGETAYVSTWRGGEVVILGIVEGKGAVRVSGTHLGFGGDAHARASGKVMLAFASPRTFEDYVRKNRPLRSCTPHTVTSIRELRSEMQEVRRLGYAIDEAEFVEGVACVGAPVADGTMAITVSSPIERFRRHRRQLIADLVRVTAETRAPGFGRSKAEAGAGAEAGALATASG
jgi:IclR family transcriptional regulator, acetate operon repressor